VELVEAIRNYQRVALDANVFIYAYQENPIFLPVVRPIFARLDEDAKFHVITSIITLIEVTVQPMRQNRQDLVTLYSSALLNSPNVSTIGLDTEIAQHTAELRAKLNLRTPDAIQVATAIVSRAEAFITNDERFKLVTDIPVLLVNDFVQK
jgi:predicted nucleic acid-binding protein